MNKVRKKTLYFHLKGFLKNPQIPILYKLMLFSGIVAKAANIMIEEDCPEGSPYCYRKKK